MARVTDTTEVSRRLRGGFREAFGDPEELAALLAAVIEQMPVAVVVAEAPSGDIVIVNPDVRHVLGDAFPLSADGPDEGNRFGFHRDGRPVRPEEWPLGRSLRGGEVVRDEEVDFVAEDGTLHTVSVSSAPIRDEEGEILAAVVVFKDVTRRVKAEAALRTARLELEGRVAKRTEELQREIDERVRIEASLRESEALLRSVFERSAIGIALMDSEARILQANPAMGSILGRSLESLYGRTFVEFTHPDDRKTDEELFGSLLVKSRDHYKVDKRFIRPGGSVIWTSLTVSAVFTRNGRNVPFAVALLEDVSDRIRSLERLREKDRAIRQAYVDVIYAVTGGKLVLMTPTEVMASLGALVAEPLLADDPRHASTVRGRVDALLAEKAPGMEGREGFVLAVAEAIANALKHAGSGLVSVYVSGGRVQVMVADEGPGIDFKNLPSAALLSGYSTKQTLGIGFSLMLEFSDRVLLTTQEGDTRIVLERQADGGGE